MKTKLAINANIDCVVLDHEKANAVADELGHILRMVMTAATVTEAIGEGQLEYRAESYTGDFPEPMEAPEPTRFTSPEKARNGDMWEIPKSRMLKAKNLVTVQKELDDVPMFKDDPFAQGMSRGMELVIAVLEGKEKL